MSNTKSNIKSTKIAAGAALVALSGFVPQPMMQKAEAASTIMTVSGSFISGITIVSVGNPNLGSIIASAATGTAKVTPGGATGGSNATVVANNAAGKIKAKYKAVKPVDVIISGFGTLAAVGATLDKVYFTGPFIATVTGGAATTTASSIAVALTGTGTKVANAGAGVSWTGGLPTAGAFAKALTVTLQY